jgi:hypothetical protein
MNEGGFIFYREFSFCRNCYIQLSCLSKHLIATCCPNHLCCTSMGFILFFLVIGIKNVTRYLFYLRTNLIIANCMMRLLKIFAASSCRLNMQFVHIEMLSQYIREPHGATSKIMFISISASKLFQIDPTEV